MSRGYAVVTGASSGIGEISARHLASLGFNVFAGVRNAAAELTERYGELVEAIKRESRKNATDGTPPQDVADAVAHALTADKPKTRYLVGRDAKIRGPIAKIVPDRIMDAAIGRALGQRKRV